MLKGAERQGTDLHRGGILDCPLLLRLRTPLFNQEKRQRAWRMTALQMSKASSEHLTVLLHAPGLRNSTGCRTTAPLTSSYIQGRSCRGQGRSCRGQGRSCRGQGRSCRGQGRSCRQYWYAYVHTSYLRPCTCMYVRYCSSIYIWVRPRLSCRRVQYIYIYYRYSNKINRHKGQKHKLSTSSSKLSVCFILLFKPFKNIFLNTLT